MEKAGKKGKITHISLIPAKRTLITLDMCEDSPAYAVLPGDVGKGCNNQTPNSNLSFKR